MSARRLLAVAALAALTACAKNAAPTPTLNLSEPSAVAVFRGVVSEYADNKGHPYIAVANAGTNELVILDAINDLPVRGPFPLRGLVFPAPGRPALLATGDLGDVDPTGSPTGGPVARPDLLVAVPSASSALQVFRTWRSDGAIVGQVELGADILALTALDFDPAAPGTVQLAAVLADQRVALVTFRRATSGPDPDAIDTVAAQASLKVSARLGFQPVAISKSPFQRGQVWVASRDDLGGGVHGVAGLDLAAMADGGAPAVTVVDAGAPTRLVAAAQVRERIPAPGEDSARLDAELLGSAALTPPPLSNRVYAVVDEGCGVDRAVGCGLVALDPVTGRIAADLVPGSTAARAPIAIPGPFAVAVGAPPAFPPPEDARYATSVIRLVTALGAHASSGVAAVPANDGSVWFVDLSRWEVPSHQLLQASMTVVATSFQPPAQVPAIPKDQWLVFADPANPTTAIKHADTAALAAAIVTTPGYTPTETWGIVKEGALPGLAVRKAEAGVDGTGLWLALQNPGGAGAVVRVWDPTLDVTAGDIVLIDAMGLGTCGQFEAVVSSVEPPRTSPPAPGGFLRLANRVTTDPRNVVWDACVSRLAAAATGAGFSDMYVSLRAGDYVLLRGTGTAARAVGRPQIGVPFELRWSDEGAVSCTLPPAAPWPESGLPACLDAACRAPCFDLVKIHHARRLGYVSEPCSTATCGAGNRWPTWPDPVGPAIAFTLALETSGPARRDLSIGFTTSDGRSPLRQSLPTALTDDPRGVVPFDRSPYKPETGVRFLVPYPGGAVLDCSPTDGSTPVEMK